MRTNLQKHLVTMTAPIFIETLLIMLLGFIDVVMLSRLSDLVVASVGLVNQLLITVCMIFMVAATGTTVLCSQYMGAGQQKNLTQSVGVGLAFNVLLGIGISVLFYSHSTTILTLLDIHPALMENARNYLSIVGGFLIFVCLNMTISGILRSCNLSRYPMYVSLVVNICNIIGNYTLIFGKFGFPALGVEGAAIATVCSRAVSVVLLLYILLRHAIKLPILANLFPFPWDKLRKMLFIGVPSAGELLSYTVSQMVIMYFINSLGPESVAARTYLMNFIMFTFLFAMSLGQGSSIVVGQLIGKNKNQAALLIGRFSLKVAIYVSFSLSILLALFAPFIFPLVTANPQILALCYTIVWVDVVLEIARAVNILAGRILSAVGNPQYPFIVGLIFMWGIGVLGSYIFGIALGFGLVGMWYMYVVDESVRAVLVWRRWQSQRWKNRGFVERV